MNTTQDLNSEWRKVAATIYQKPVDSKILGMAEIDITALEAYIAEKRKHGVKITLTHVFVRILSKALKEEVPELNVYLKRGKIKHRNSIDAGVSVLKASGEMSSIMVNNADTLSFKEMADYMNSKIVDSKKGSENDTMQSKNFLARIPWPFRRWIFKLYQTITLSWGISMPGAGLSANSFGSFLLTNIGSLGLDNGFPALLPSSNISFVFVLGGNQKKPVVVNDEIVIRKMMSISIVMDHRVADASQGGKLYRYIRRMVRTPHLLDE